MTTKTYTKRTNARCAAIAAGVPGELVQITVHKNGEEVRFGWTAKQPPANAAQHAVNTPAATATENEPMAPAVAVQGVTTGKPKKAAAPKVERIEQNGVKRPGPGKCLEVWEYLDQHGNMTPKDLKPVAAEKGWNENNALIEMYGWRRFNGISGRVKATA